MTTPNETITRLRAQCLKSASVCEAAAINLTENSVGVPHSLIAKLRIEANELRAAANAD